MLLLRASWRWIAGIAIFTAMAALPALHLALYQDRPWALAAGIGPIAAVATFRRAPYVAAGSLVVSSVLLQLGYIGVGYSDQIDLGRAALDRVVAGQSPYGVMYANSAGGTNPFAYGPVAMLTAMGGPPLELIASICLLATIAATRSWLTLGLVAAFPPYVYQAATGVNDYTVSLVLTAGLLALGVRPRVAMLLIAVAAAMKPYAAAWFLPAIGFAGWSAALWLVGATMVLWSPVLSWGVGSYIDSLRLVATAAAPPGWATNSIPVPWVRLLGVPIAFSGLLARQWHIAILIGSAAFAAVMFFGDWASLGYWVALLPITGIAIERAWLSRACLDTNAALSLSDSSVHLGYRSRHGAP